MFRKHLALLSLLLVVGFALLCAGCSDKDRDGLKPSPSGDVTNVTFRFKLDEDIHGKGTVPCNVAKFAFQGFVAGAQKFATEFAKDAVTQQAQVQVVELKDVPTKVDKFIVRYLAADDSLVAETVVEDVDLTKEKEIVIDDKTPVVAANLTVKLDENATIPDQAKKYSVVMVDSASVEIYKTKISALPYQPLVIEDIPLNLAEVYIYWYDDSVDKYIGVTIERNIPDLEVGKPATVTITGEPITTGTIKATLADGFAVPETATQYRVAVYDSEGTERAASKKQPMPFQTVVLEVDPYVDYTAVLEFIDANDIVVAKSTEEVDKLEPAEEREVKFDEIKYFAKLHLTNCYVLANAIDTVSYTVVYKDGKSFESTTDYSADGEYSIDLTSTGPISVSSVVLKDDKGTPFEWLDYAEPQTDLELDVDKNGFYKEENNVRYIANPRQLSNIAVDLTGSYKLANDIDFDGSCGISFTADSGVKVENENARFFGNVATGQYGWSPIGNSDDAFRGAMKGEGYTVSGLLAVRYDATDAAADNVGLFGVASGASIENIKFDNSCAFVGRDNVGSVCGYVFASNEMTACTSSALVAGRYYGGGLVGLAGKEGEDNKLTFKSCEFNGKIAGLLAGGTTAGTYDFGGIVGCIIVNDNTQINDCVYAGDTTAAACIGGIIGVIGESGNDDCGEITVKNCKVSGTLISTATTTASNTCGVVGQATMAWPLTLNIEGCVVDASLRGTARVAGMVDQTCCYNRGSRPVGELNVITIKDCEFAGKITVKSSSVGKNGGLVGGLIANQWYAGEIVFDGTNKVTGTIDYPADVLNHGIGGVIGSANSADWTAAVKQMVKDHVTVGANVVKSSATDKIGRYCGSPYCDDINS